MNAVTMKESHHDADDVGRSESIRFVRGRQEKNTFHPTLPCAQPNYGGTKKVRAKSVVQ